MSRIERRIANHSTTNLRMEVISVFFYVLLTVHLSIILVYVLLTVHLSIILVINQLNTQILVL